jgi:hypothetical protein
MLKQSTHYFEALLGIYAPWTIDNIIIDEKYKLIEIEVSPANEKSVFSFLSKTHDADKNAAQKRRWNHINLGHYSCYIVSAYQAKLDQDLSLIQSTLLQPQFLGDAQSSYTHLLRQQVCLAKLRGLDASSIASLFKIDAGLVEKIISDIAKLPDNIQLACSLPTEIDNVWEKILLDKFPLKTQVVPLKLLLSKLKLTNSDTRDDQQLKESVLALRKFFMAQARALEAEYCQICGINNRKQLSDERQSTSTRLLLPSLKNSIWLKMITGKINLNSTNVSFNLFLTRLRHAFQNSRDNNERLNTLNSLREFFRKNARLLKTELIQINKLIATPEDTQYSLPDEQHKVWRRVLKEDGFIQSDHVAYKLLLANLRSQITMNPDPVIELNAVRRLRDFLSHNQKTMQQELRSVLKTAYGN